MQNGTTTTAEADLDQLSSLFRLLSDKTRLQILMLLVKGERNVSSLCEELTLPQPTVSHHLGLMRLSSIISGRRSGKQMFYAINGRVGLTAAGALELSVDHHTVRITTRLE